MTWVTLRTAGQTVQGSRGAGYLERGDEGSGGHVLLGVVDLVEVQFDCLGEIAQGFGDRAALACHIDLEALRHVPVLFLVYSGGEVPRGAHVSSVASSTSSVNMLPE